MKTNLSAIELSESERRDGFRPEKTIQPVGPMYQWPLSVTSIMRWIIGYVWPWLTFFAVIALLAWQFLSPDLDQLEHFSVSWIAALFVRNLVLLVVFVSMQHVLLYIKRIQGIDYKYNPKWLSTDNPAFLFGNQLWDNVFWNVCSAVPIWTGYEAWVLWLHANGSLRTVTWEAHPVYCVFLVLVMPLLLNVHFYTTHRLIHWKPLYRTVHRIHHNNVNIGPWSGLAMHPVEHLIYFSAVGLCWIIPTHPFHGVFILLYLALGASLQHLGFDRVMSGDKSAIGTEHYMHYLHHKYITVNFSTDHGLMPLDKWLGTFHDGSEESQKEMIRRARERGGRSRPE